MSKIMDEEMRKLMEAYSGKKLENRKEMSQERKQELKEALQMMQKKQEERRRLKETDPEAYQKLREEEHERMMNDPNYVGSGVWREETPDDGKKQQKK